MSKLTKKQERKAWDNLGGVLTAALNKISAEDEQRLENFKTAVSKIDLDAEVKKLEKQKRLERIQKRAEKQAAKVLNKLAGNLWH